MGVSRSRTAGSIAGSGGDLGGFYLLGAFAVLAVVDAALWAGGGIASLTAGHGWRSAPFGMFMPATIARVGTAALWPGTTLPGVLAFAAALAALVLVPAGVLAVRWALRRPLPGDPLPSLASPSDVRPMLPAAAADSARRLRPSLAAVRAKDLPPADRGLLLGELRPRGPRLFASWEDVVVAVMAPRSGKTTALAIPAVLDAPGPVVATANKADLHAATAELRAADTGERVWTFDPQRIARSLRSWWWDPIGDLADVEDAERLASHFVLTVDDERAKDIWGPAAQELLAALLMAAKVSRGTLLDVYRWLNAESDPDPVDYLRPAYPLLSASLEGTMRAPAETRGSVYFTARTAAKCLRNPAITEWVTPPEGCLEMFDPAAFVRARQSLYLLSKDGGGSAAPLVAALTDRVLRAAVVAAEGSGGRLDPPLVAVLDEAANICRIGDLPALYSHLGSRGVIPLTILQSYAQAVGVWGKGGTATLWSAATVKLIGSGADDAAFAEDVSRLVGEHDVLSDSYSSGGAGRGSRTRSTRRERILSAAEVRALPKGTALLLSTGARPALIRTLPWYSGPRAAAIGAAVARAVTRIAADRPDDAQTASAARGGAA